MTLIIINFIKFKYETTNLPVQLGNQVTETTNYKK